MFLFRWPASLWFLGGGGTATGTAEVCVSVAYNLSASVSEFDRDIELSAFAFNLSVVFIPDNDEDDTPIRVGVDLLGDSFDGVALQASIVPVFILDQTGSQTPSVSVAYNLTASVTATIFPDVVPVLAYGLSASLSAVLLIADNVSVSVAYNITASIQFTLQVQPGDQTFSEDVVCALSCSISPQITIDSGGGLVYSRSKQEYIPVRVGYPLRE